MELATSITKEARNTCTHAHACVSFSARLKGERSNTHTLRIKLTGRSSETPTGFVVKKAPVIRERALDESTLEVWASKIL